MGGASSQLDKNPDDVDDETSHQDTSASRSEDASVLSASNTRDNIPNVGHVPNAENPSIVTATVNSSPRTTSLPQQQPVQKFQSITTMLRTLQNKTFQDLLSRYPTSTNGYSQISEADTTPAVPTAEDLRTKVARNSTPTIAGTKDVHRMTVPVAAPILASGSSIAAASGINGVFNRLRWCEDEDNTDYLAPSAESFENHDFTQRPPLSSLQNSKRDHDRHDDGSTSSSRGLWFGSIAAAASSSSSPPSADIFRGISSDRTNRMSGTSPQLDATTTTTTSRPPPIPTNVNNASNKMPAQSTNSTNKTLPNQSISVSSAIQSTNTGSTSPTRSSSDMPTFGSISYYKPIKPLPKRRSRPPGVGPLPLPSVNSITPTNATTSAAFLGAVMMTTSSALPVPGRASFDSPIIHAPPSSTYVPALSDSDETDDGTGMSANANGQSGRKKAVPGNKKKKKRTAPGSGLERSPSRDRTSGGNTSSSSYEASSTVGGTSASNVGHHQQTQHRSAADEIFRLAGPPSYSYSTNGYYNFSSSSSSSSAMAPFASPAAYGAGLPPSLFISPPAFLPPTLNMLNSAAPLGSNGLLNAGSVVPSRATTNSISSSLGDVDQSVARNKPNELVSDCTIDSNRQQQQRLPSTDATVFSFEFGAGAFMDRQQPPKPLNPDDPVEADDDDIDYTHVPNTLEKLPDLLEDAELEALIARESSNALVRSSSGGTSATTASVVNTQNKNRMGSKGPPPSNNSNQSQPKLANTLSTINRAGQSSNMHHAISAANAMFGAAINNAAGSNSSNSGHTKKGNKSRNKRGTNTSHTLDPNLPPVPATNAPSRGSNTQQHLHPHTNPPNNPPPPPPVSTDPLSRFSRPTVSFKYRRNKYRTVMRRVLDDRAKWSTNNTFDGAGTGSGDNDGDGDWLCFFCEYEQVFSGRRSVEKREADVSGKGKK
ncbi:hypothetical protein SeMB42_g06237 [Synchytrium endobioticum]|uniref:Uncharacterized protein n=1 Tax=Synchytrium endobioticum TaxID=286115 RepID=A0A507CMD3_9FUNG|nr:hypothetical protein SeMB42_g06237 [Synchytrium endobioticum]TPX49465.1 hypothetical protein SeLEV6574_g01473 [Synchytrium endobioticum]